MFHNIRLLRLVGVGLYFGILTFHHQCLISYDAWLLVRFRNASVLCRHDDDNYRDNDYCVGMQHLPRSVAEKLSV